MLERVVKGVVDEAEVGQELRFSCCRDGMFVLLKCQGDKCRRNINDQLLILSTRTCTGESKGSCDINDHNVRVKASLMISALWSLKIDRSAW